MARSEITSRAIRDRLGYTVENAGKQIGLGRSAAYRAAQAGVIPVRRIGLKLLIVPKAPWDRKVKRLLSGTASQKRDRARRATRAESAI
jgi:hypothetical protein